LTHSKKLRRQGNGVVLCFLERPSGGRGSCELWPRDRRIGEKKKKKNTYKEIMFTPHKKGPQQEMPFLLGFPQDDEALAIK